ncbi:hypothetical protein [Nitratifractor salsuginis]|uniref:Lipoprotein n=1 Tax=Nitratifractor salsuginis (strain DSM 16511 / JCM 12458 / E9I37-1) TaxID=749222 RepID=E6X1Z7_NITSE|nr:hypothetical protein [Nitratifractor salsuginis]ADV46005.1 hypothetical protein Nitsa_0738 [Nitratifractor salsuginis DSM 16511]
MQSKNIYRFFSFLILFSLVGLMQGCQGTSQDGLGSSDKKQETNPDTGKDSKAGEGGWYMRTRVSATAEDGTVYQHNTAGVFGRLVDSWNGKDRHDIPAYGPAALQVVFPHYNWGDKESGDYWSDYRSYPEKGSNERAVWTFQVKNQKSVDLSNADIRIKLDDARRVDFVKIDGNIRYKETGLNQGMKNQFTLVDVDNKQTYSVDELDKINLNMDGKHIRTFRWVRGPVLEEDFKPVVLPK